MRLAAVKGPCPLLPPLPPLRPGAPFLTFSLDAALLRRLPFILVAEATRAPPRYSQLIHLFHSVPRPITSLSLPENPLPTPLALDAPSMHVDVEEPCRSQFLIPPTLGPLVLFMRDLGSLLPFFLSPPLPP